MKSTLKILKDNMFTIFIIIVFIMGMFVLSYLKKIYWDNNDKAAYGDRVEDIGNHEIDNSEIKKIEENIKDDKNVIEAKYDLEGRIINLTITVKDDISVKNAKSIGNNTLNNFDEDQLSYYSVQIYIIKENDSLDDFPINGYKHYSNSEISWTKDREATNNED